MNKPLLARLALLARLGLLALLGLPVEALAQIDAAAAGSYGQAPSI